MRMAYANDERCALVTGASRGIGREIALGPAAAGFRVGLACRSVEGAQRVVDAIDAAGGRAEVIPVDLASLRATRAAADAAATRFPRLDVLVNNAGAGQRGLTEDGFELAWQSNHLGHYLLTRLLLPSLSAAPAARVVNVASKEHLRPRDIDWEAVRRPSSPMRFSDPLRDYGVAKLAMVAFSRRLAELAPRHVHTYALHPGVVATDAYRDLPPLVVAIARRFMKTPAQGAATPLMCALSDEVAEHSGRYYSDEALAEPNPLVEDAAFRYEVWERSAAMVGLASG